ncbi:MAG: hypothetical protein GX572_01605, partial [Clostridia bacterium]|nr:hypothetical protein [Clostridia bacterium]
ADQLCLHDEEIATDRPLTIFDPQATWKHKTLRHFIVRELLQPVFRSGGLVYEQPPLAQTRDYCAAQLATLWEETKRFKNPHRYYVDLSQRLWRIRDDLLRQNGRADMARQGSEPK